MEDTKRDRFIYRFKKFLKELVISILVNSVLWGTAYLLKAPESLAWPVIISTSIAVLWVLDDEPIS
jgi:hypothetical protein